MRLPPRIRLKDLFFRAAPCALVLWVCVLGLLCGCGSSADGPSMSTNGATVPFRVQADHVNGRVVFLNSEIVLPEGRRVALGTVGEQDPLPVQKPEFPVTADENLLFRVASQGTWTRVFSRWNLDGGSPTHQVSPISDPVSAQVTDKAIYFRTRDFDVPSTDGTYVYSVRWENGKGASVTDTSVFTVSGESVTVRSKVNDGPFVVEFTGPKETYDVSAIVSGLALAGNAWEPPGWPRTVPEWNTVATLTPLTDDELEAFVGRWTLHQDLNGVAGDVGEFDLRMLTLKDLQVDPPHFDPSLPPEDAGSSTTLKCDIVTRPGPNESFPQGWRPTAPVDWKVWITDANSQPIKTLTGQAVVRAPDATGKVGAINVTWRGEKDDGTLAPPGTYPFQLRALGNLTLGNALTRPISGQFQIGQQEIKITQVAATPENFDPITENSTTLSFDLSTEGLGNSPDIHWTVSVVATETQMTLHEFPVSPGAHGPGTVTLHSPTSLHVDLAWDGRHNSAPVAGEFTWVIKANARMTGGGGIPVMAEARLVNENDALTLMEIKADAAVAYQDEDGQAIADPTLYYSDSSPASSHQLVLATDPNAAAGAGIAAKSLGPVTGPFVQELILVLERASTSAEVKYQVRLVDPDKPEQVLTASQEIPFETGQKRASVLLRVKFPQKVHKYPYLKAQTRRTTKAVWLDVKKQHPLFPVYYTPFGDPKEPFQKGETLSQKVLDLAWEIEEGVETPDLARRRASTRLMPWLRERNFTYTLSQGQCGFPAEGQYFSEQRFNFRDFISPLTTGQPFRGDCHDIASLEVMCCAAVGVEHALFDFVPGDGLGHMETNYLYVNAAFVPTFDETGAEVGSEKNPEVYRRYPFGDHEIAYWRDRPGELGRAWSGLAFVQDVPQGDVLGGLGINQYLDLFLSSRQVVKKNKVISITPHTWITFQNPGNPLPYPDPRTGVEPIRLTVIRQ